MMTEFHKVHRRKMMKQITFYAICAMAICTLGACGKNEAKTEAKSAEKEKVENVAEENDSTKLTEEVDDSPIVTQMELNDEAGGETVMLKDSIEEVFQAVIKAYPESKDIFEGELVLWEKYYEAAKKVAKLEDGEGSSLYFYYAVVEQALTLRRESFQYLMMAQEGKKISPSKTRFTPAMIKEAYDRYVNATQQYLKSNYSMDESEWTDLERAISEEERCWNKWMEYRVAAAARLPEKTCRIYKTCSNRMMRTKLFQLKNQNRALGITSSEAWECRLQDDCTDEELLAYPGYDKMWEKMMQ